MNQTKAHCNECGNERNHDILHFEETSWESEWKPGGTDEYEMLKCRGCDSIKLRHTCRIDGDPRPDLITYYPPALFRQRPDWFSELKYVKRQDRFVHMLLEEIYTALHNNLPRLACMGVRSLIEKIMISQTEDKGTFGANLDEFEKLGYVSRKQRERVKTILEAGHATTHRDFSPQTVDVITLVDITEHIVQSVYLHDSKVAALKERVPARKKRPKADNG